MKRLAAAALAAAALAGCSFLVKTDDLVNGEPPRPGMDGGDGGGPPGPVVTVASGQNRPLGIAVSAEFVVWVNQDPASLRRAAKDGTGQRSLEPPDLIQPDVFDIAADAEFVYWTEVSRNQVSRKPISGMGTRMRVFDGPGQVAFLAVEGAQFYVSNYVVGGRIADARQSLYTESDVIGGLAVQGNFLFWARQNDRTIVSGGIAGGNPMSTSVVARTGGRPMGVAVDRDHIYWIEDGVRLQKLPRSGGTTPITLHTAARPFGDSDVAVDDTAVYWTQQNDGLVMKVAK